MCLFDKIQGIIFKSQSTSDLSVRVFRIAWSWIYTNSYSVPETQNLY